MAPQHRWHHETSYTPGERLSYGIQVTLYPTLIQLNHKNYLVDCGYQETYDELVSQLQSRGVSVADLHAILISHDDIDHLGALSLLKEGSRLEADSISGQVNLERLVQAEASLA